MKNFYLGMDIGTDSIGMACADENYNLLRAKGKDLWAVRLFDEAVTSESRRIARLARRKLQRRRKRIELLQEIFSSHIKDDLFFLRLNNSGYLYDDKDSRLESRFSLFADNNFTDSDFYKKYPTVFHLRKELMDQCGKYDLRLYYLAIHHILKYRGHFLFEGQSDAEIDETELFNRLDVAVLEVYGEQIYTISKEEAKQILSICLEKSGQKDKLNKLKVAVKDEDNKQLNEILVLLSGGSSKPSNIFFGKDEYVNEKSISLSKMTDDDFEGLFEIYGDDFVLLEAVKSIFDYIKFKNVLGNKRYISDAMIAIYDKHGEDLKKLKKLLLNDKNIYDKVFRSQTENYNYVNYVGFNKISGKKTKYVKKCKPEEFYKFLKKILSENIDIFDRTIVNEILNEIEKNEFLPKIINSDNGLFPHQVNGAELNNILSGLIKNYPEFSVLDEDGYSAVDKIKAIFNFKIPYYVGPLNSSHSINAKDGHGHSWFVRKEEGRITPWNFKQKVDLALSNEVFMRNMTSKCSYLKGKDVLPKCSILYQRFNTLNQLNKIQINSKYITVEQKQKIFNDLFLTKSKVGVLDIKRYMRSMGWLDENEFKTAEITGVDGDLKPSMSSYVVLKGILGNFVDDNPEICENIILWHSLNTDKNIVVDLILKHYGSVGVIKENIRAIKSLTFKDFGKLSKEFLSELKGGVDEVTGEVYTIIGELYNTNYNLNELLYNEKYSFLNAIDVENAFLSDEISYEDVEDLYVSPAVRRGIWQSLLMVDEYVSVVGRTPDKIFVEVTRENDKKPERTLSRKAQIENLYKTVKEIDGLLDELKTKTDSDLRSERLYLYFMQLGRCAYTGKRIDLESLSGDLYDVDHIIPRSLTKDDSIDNKVLVLREKNKEKANVYPIPSGFTDQRGFWKILNEKGLMSKSKYDRLARIEPLSEQDYNGFIRRQIVVTNQTAKSVIELLKRKFEKSGTEIVYSKAGNVSEFKNKYGFIKCRETNDLHHARDAYLNIVVGNVYNSKFKSLYSYFYKDKDGLQREVNYDKLFERPVNGAWEGAEQIGKIKKIYYRSSMAVTRYAFIRKGEFYDQTIYGKEDKGVKAPRKGNGVLSDLSKYGGYKSLNTAFFTVVKSKDKNGKKQITIEPIPVMLDYVVKGDEDKIKDYLLSQGLVEPEIIVKKLKMKQLVEVNGFPVWLAGFQGKYILLHNAVEWFTDSETDAYIKGLGKLYELFIAKKLSKEEEEREEYKINTNRFNDSKLIVDRKRNIETYENIVGQISKKIYSGISGAEAFKNNLLKGKQIFESLTVLKQAETLLQCIKFFKCNAENQI